MLKSQSTELFVNPEELQRITFYANQNQRLSHKPAKVYEEQYAFKPQINKKSINIQRTVEDLYRWNERKAQKLQQCYEDTTLELQQNANRLTHEMDSNQPSVFERLYVVKKINEVPICINYSNKYFELTKRNTCESQPYFTKNMSSTLFSEYKKQITTPEKQQQFEDEKEQHQQQQQELSANRPCLASRFYSNEIQVQQNEEPKVSIPQHTYIDLKQEIEQINNEPEPIPQKKPLNKKEIDLMVERMNTWLQKRNYKTQEQQERILENESNECTFYPKLSNKQIAQKSNQNSQRVSQQSSYSTLFRNKNN